MPNFWQLALTPILKINEFPLGKNISNFVSPSWKLNNPYYHTKKTESSHCLWQPQSGQNLILIRMWIIVLPWFYDLSTKTSVQYENWPCSRTTKRLVCQKYFNCTSNQVTKHQNAFFKKHLVPLWRLYQHSFGLCKCPCDLQKVVAQCAPNLW